MPTILTICETPRERTSHRGFVDLGLKFASNAAFGGWAKERAERLLEFCETLEDSKDLSALAEFRG